MGKSLAEGIGGSVSVALGLSCCSGLVEGLANISELPASGPATAGDGADEDIRTA